MMTILTGNIQAELQEADELPEILKDTRKVKINGVKYKFKMVLTIEKIK